MKNGICHRGAFAVVLLTLLMAFPAWVTAAPPDLTQSTNVDRTYTYNLGPTGARGWIYNKEGSGQLGTISALSRQILITAVGTNTPASDVLQVDDVILGAGVGGGAVPLFASDARKSLGWAIGEAEKTANNGILKLKRWRAGIASDVQLQLQVMDSYSDTSPYDCPKSALILTNACTIIKNESFEGGFAGPVKGLALLATGDPQYLPKVRDYARALAPPSLHVELQEGMFIWEWSYRNIFLCEYYLSTGDTSVLHGIAEYTIALAKGQDMYGTFGHGISSKTADGGLHGSGSGYGPVNSAGLVANIAIVLGKKCGVVDPEINPAIDRGNKFFSYFVGKGTIPYGEHEPWGGGYADNGKNAMCAVLFGLQDNLPAETEFFTRMTTAGYNGREYGHTGQGFSYLWGALGANVGGPEAVAAYLKEVRWHLDLSRRSDGSFVYDGGEQYGGSHVDDYWGASSYYGLSPTATYVLYFALSKKHLLITGKNADQANWLSTQVVAETIADGRFYEDCKAYSTNQLLGALGEWLPVVRSWAADELATRTNVTALVPQLIVMAEGADAKARQGACQALGAIKDTRALPVLIRLLEHEDRWLRAKAAKALRAMGEAARPVLANMLTAAVTTAEPSQPIEWADPIQIAHGALAEVLFRGLLSNSIVGVDRNLLYPAIQAVSRNADGMARHYLNGTIANLLTFVDIQALAPDIIEAIRTKAPADTMFGDVIRIAGLRALSKYYIAEGIPLSTMLLKEDGWGDADRRPGGMDALTRYRGAAQSELPELYSEQSRWQMEGWTQFEPQITQTIAAIANDPNPPPVILAQAPVANGQSVFTDNTAKAITLTGSDWDGDPLTYAIVTQPAHGTLSGTAPNVTYTPAPNYAGMDKFTFRVNDGQTSSAAATVIVLNGISGTGLKGEYYDNVDFTALKLTRTDPTVNFDWGTGSPSTLIGGDTFTVRWTGQVIVPESGRYRFSTISDDGVRLWVNGSLLIDDWTDHPSKQNDSVFVTLTGGQKYDLKLEYYESGGGAVAKLMCDGAFASIVIPKEWLYNGSATNNRIPMAYAQGVTTAEDTAKVILLAGGDANFDPLSYSIVTPPAHGTLSGTPPSVTYSPAANYNGADSFTFMVNDGKSNSEASAVEIVVSPVNDVSLVCLAAEYAGPSSTSAVLKATLACDEPAYDIYAYWGTTNGGTDAMLWTYSAQIGSWSNVASTNIGYPVTGLIQNTQYFFTFRATNAAGDVWAGNVLSFGPSSAKDMLTFGLPGMPAVIAGTDIAWTVLYSAVVTNLAPTFTLSAGASAAPDSGTARNFTSPQTYTVTAEDGSTEVYTVTVIAPPAWLNVNIDTAARTSLIGPAGGAGKTWNQAVGGPGGIGGISASAMLDSGGLATTAGFTTNAGNLYSWGTPSLKLLTGGAFQWNWNSPANLVISGLTAGKKYDLYIASFHPNELGSRSLFSTLNPTATSAVQIADTGGPNGNSTTWIRGVNYVRFQNMEPDATNTITVTMVGDSGTNQKRAYLSGFQLVDVTPTKDILTFVFPGLPAATISGTNIRVTVPYATDVTALVPTYTLSPGATVAPASGIPRNFTTPQTYTVTAEDGSTKVYTVTVDKAAASPAKDILTFVFPGLQAVKFSGTGISVNVPLSTDVTALAPTYTLSPLATAAPTSGSTQNFINPVPYTVTAEDLSTKVYTVTIIKIVASPLINVNIDTTSRTERLLVGPAGGEGTTWNQAVGGPGDIGGLSASALLDSGGLSGTVGFTLDAGNLLDWGNPSLQLLAGSAFQSNWDTSADLVMSGLAPGYYDLYIASYHPNQGGGRSLFSTLDTTTTVGTQIADNGGPDGNSQAWEQGVNYVLFHNMVPNPVNNEITVTMAGDSGDNFTRAYLSGFQLVWHEESTIFTAKDILSFGLPHKSLPGNLAVIAATDIAWAVPDGTDVANLAPTYTVSPLATGDPVSGTKLDFTNPVAYTVTAEDGSTQVYTVTVTVNPIIIVNWKRGDANADGTADISDAIMVLRYLYLGETSLLCLDAADANDDGELDISDVIRLLFHLFLGVQPLPAPFPGCGIDPMIDGLDCADYTGC